MALHIQMRLGCPMHALPLHIQRKLGGLVHLLQWPGLRQLCSLLEIYFPSFGASGCNQLIEAPSDPPFWSCSENQENICAEKDDLISRLANYFVLQFFGNNATAVSKVWNILHVLMYTRTPQNIIL